MTSGKAITKAIDALVATKSHSATVYISEAATVRVTRLRYRGRRFDHRKLEVRLTIGRPNHAARKFIRLAKAAGEPFPIRKVQLK